MNQRCRLMFFAGWFCGATALCMAAESDSTITAGDLRIVGLEQGMIVTVDQHSYDEISAANILIDSGIHRIIVSADLISGGQILDTTILFAGGLSLIFKIPPICTYQFTSDPSGASVEKEGRILGITPTKISLRDTLRTPLIFALTGYQPQQIDPPFGSLVSATLRPSLQSPDQSIFSDDHGIRRNTSLVYGSIAAAIIAGSISVYAKQKANSLDDDFELTKEQSLQSRRNRYDLVAGVTLAITQISIGVLSYLLLQQ